MNDSIEQKITQKIEDIVEKNNIYHVGKVIKINSFIVEVSGLDDAFYFEKIIIKDESNIGYVDKIEENKVIIALVKQGSEIRIGDSVLTTGEVISSSFSKDALGMVIDPFGYDKMSGRKFSDSTIISIETPKIGIMERTDVNRPLETGIAAIDLLFPIGRGQRQLIIGDKKTGKTQICLDTIVNQKDKNMICIYVAIGKTKKELKKIYTKLVQKGASQYTIIVAAFNDDPAPLIKLTPYVGVSIAEQFMYEGKDVLVCIDDLKKHADACREIALIGEKNTGRDAYPADIFYSHSRLLEKGCQHINKGSITILPITETKGEDITDYISTNIISITDGQIVMSNKWFKKGQKPAINYGLSVSRLGGAVQKDSIKKIGSKVRQELLSYLETADVYQLVDVNSLSPELREKIARGEQLLNLLRQPKFSPLSEEKLIEKFGFILEDKKQEQVSETPQDSTGDEQENNASDVSENDSVAENNEPESQTTENVTNDNPAENISETTEEQTDLAAQTDMAMPVENTAAAEPVNEMPEPVPMVPETNTEVIESTPSEVPPNTVLTNDANIDQVIPETSPLPNTELPEPVPMMPVTNTDVIETPPSEATTNTVLTDDANTVQVTPEGLPLPNTELPEPVPMMPISNTDVMESAPNEVPPNLILTNDQASNAAQITPEVAPIPDAEMLEAVPMMPVLNTEAIETLSTEEPPNVVVANNTESIDNQVNSFAATPEPNKEIPEPIPNLTNLNDNSLVNEDINKSSTFENNTSNDHETLPKLSKAKSSKTSTNKTILPTLSTDATTKTNTKAKKDSVKPPLKPRKVTKSSTPEIGPKLEANNIKPTLSPIKPEITKSSKVTSTTKKAKIKPALSTSSLDSSKVKNISKAKDNKKLDNVKPIANDVKEKIVALPQITNDEEIKPVTQTVKPLLSETKKEEVKPVLEKDSKNKNKSNTEVGPKLTIEKKTSSKQASKDIAPTLKTETKKKEVKPVLEKEPKNKDKSTAEIEPKLITENRSSNKQTSKDKAKSEVGPKLDSTKAETSTTIPKPIGPTLKTEAKKDTIKPLIELEKSNEIKPILDKEPKGKDKSTAEIEPKLTIEGSNKSPSKDKVKPEIGPKLDSTKVETSATIPKPIGPTLTAEAKKETIKPLIELDKEPKNKGKSNIEIEPKLTIEKEGSNKSTSKDKAKPEIGPKLDSTKVETGATIPKSVGPTLTAEVKKDAIKPSLEIEKPKEDSNKLTPKDKVKPEIGPKLDSTKVETSTTIPKSIGPTLTAEVKKESIKPSLNDDKEDKLVLKPLLEVTKTDSQKDTVVNKNSKGEQIEMLDAAAPINEVEMLDTNSTKPSGAQSNNVTNKAEEVEMLDLGKNNAPVTSTDNIEML